MTALVGFFFDDDGNQVGRDMCPYPPGATRVQVGYAMTEANALTLTPHEVAQVEDALDAPPDPLLPFVTVPYHWDQPGVEPAGGAILFGGDGREVVAGEERPLYPLLAKCKCGRNITRQTSDTPWMHCD